MPPLHAHIILIFQCQFSTVPVTLDMLLCAQPPRSTRSSSLVTLAHPSTSSSLWITDRSFQYASPGLWNQLPASLHQPWLISPFLTLPIFWMALFPSIPSTHYSHHPSPPDFHSGLKTFLFCKSFSPYPSFSYSGLTSWIPRTVYRYF